MNYRNYTQRLRFPLGTYLHQQHKAKAKKQLEIAIGGAHQVLGEATTIFPFTLFPDTVTVDRTKMTVAHRTFFRVAEVMSVNIEDILNVTANVGPFFGSLRISTRYFDTDKPYYINWLWRSDALHLKHILHGCIIAGQQGIDTSGFETKELSRLLSRLGEGVVGKETT
jgi:hypothetical protein